MLLLEAWRVSSDWLDQIDRYQHTLGHDKHADTTHWLFVRKLFFEDMSQLPKCNHSKRMWWSLYQLARTMKLVFSFLAKQKFSPQESEASFWILKISFQCHPQDSKKFYFVTHTTDTSRVRLIFVSQKNKPKSVRFESTFSWDKKKPHTTSISVVMKKGVDGLGSTHRDMT